MSTIERKERLIKKISSIENEELLLDIEDLIDLEPSSQEVYVLSPEEVAAVKDGIEQIEKGMSMSNDEARKIFDKCLGK
jgi:hypothetical protein